MDFFHIFKRLYHRKVNVRGEFELRTFISIFKFQCKLIYCQWTHASETHCGYQFQWIISPTDFLRLPILLTVKVDVFIICLITLLIFESTENLRASINVTESRVFTLFKECALKQCLPGSYILNNWVHGQFIVLYASDRYDLMILLASLLICLQSYR